MLPLRGAWWAVRLECHSAPAGTQTREDCHRWIPRAHPCMVQFSIAPAGAACPLGDSPAVGQQEWSQGDLEWP